GARSARGRCDGWARRPHAGTEPAGPVADAAQPPDDLTDSTRRRAGATGSGRAQVRTVQAPTNGSLVVALEAVPHLLGAGTEVVAHAAGLERAGELLHPGAAHLPEAALEPEGGGEHQHEAEERHE